jgi:acyl-ACP thioesterase
VEKPDGRNPLRRHTRRWDDNSIIERQEVGCGGMDWIELAQYKDRWVVLVKAVLTIRVPINADNFLTS